MGFGILGGQALFIFAIVIALTTYIATNQQQALSAHDSSQTLQASLLDKHSSSFTVLNSSYNSTTNITEVEIQYKGNNVFSRNVLDVYLNKNLFSRKDNRVRKTISVDTANTNLIDSADHLTITINQSLAQGNHEIYVIGPNTATARFTVTATT